MDCLDQYRLHFKHTFVAGMSLEDIIRPNQVLISTLPRCTLLPVLTGLLSLPKDT
jgi:hypothetical protein